MVKVAETNNESKVEMKTSSAAEQPKVPLGRYQRIAVSALRLDQKNPRLAELGVPSDATQHDLVKALWDEMAVEEVALSIGYSGYFEHEPLFVEKSVDDTYVVIEGNRRLAAVMLLTDAVLRQRVKATNLPKITPEQREELEELPVIVTTRQEAWRYLGFKHVNGPATWGSYAKAQYIAFVHKTYGVPLAAIADQIGDRNSTVLRMYRGLMIIEQAEKAKVFSRADIAKKKFSFNYIYTGMDYPGISNFLGLKSKGVTSDKPVPPSKMKPLGDLLLWLYGKNSKNIDSLIRSQNPDLKTLDSILLTEAGVRALRDGLPLTVARDISEGDERIFRKSLQHAKQSLQKALGTLTTGYTSSDSDMLRIAGDIQSLTNDLLDAMTTKKARDKRDEKKDKANRN